MSYERLETFLEFLIFGVAMGLLEDFIAIKVATDATFTWETMGLILLVAIPFAAIGELIVDRVDWLSR